MSEARRGHEHDSYIGEITLRDGSVALVRPIRPDDAGEMRAMFGRLSARTVYRRFHHHVARMSDDDILRFTEVDYDNRFSLVAVHEGDERIIGTVFYARTEGYPQCAEVAITVEDEHQRLGLGPQLMEVVTQAAKDHGVTVFEADVLANNEPMIKVLRESPHGFRSSLKYGELHVTLPIDGESAREFDACEVCPI
jgi:RimJ/RimL family protein N-acetyltransferase